MPPSDPQHSCVPPASPACLGVLGGAAVRSAAVCSAGCGEPMCAAEISAGSGALQSVYLAPCAPRQCFSLEEDDLNLTSLDAETILEAEEILGTMQNYLDSSVISIIEDLSLNEVGAHVGAGSSGQADSGCGMGGGGGSVPHGRVPWLRPTAL